MGNSHAKDCPGWATVDTDRGIEIQACDECCRFVSDAEALRAARAAWTQLFTGNVTDDPLGIILRALGESVDRNIHRQSRMATRRIRDCVHALAREAG